tara:strand:+ start:174 stop:932 length:759 start_codon:yes stop_codon:yes gene_type:complete
MSIDFFKQKYGYEIEDVWVPRVTAVTSLMYRGDVSFGFMRNAMNWGTLVHETIQSMLQGEVVEVNPKIAPSIEAFDRWQKKNNFIVQDPLHAIEKRVSDSENLYAGTIDIVAEMDGKRGIVDLKTSLEISDHYALQTAAYLHAYNMGEQQSLFPNIKYDACETRWIVRIDQYQECKGCLARLREKSGKPVVREGRDSCNHQWSEVQGEIECREFTNQEQDMQAFLAAKDVWEWQNKQWLKQIQNYPRNAVLV